MRIESIRLVNWGPYVDQTLSLEGIPSLMVVGQNGHGKSMIIDGATWCGWGECRAKSVDDLVRKGTEGCMVEMVFSTAGHRYRIERSRSLKGRGSSGLRFWRIDGAAEETLDGAGMRDTEARIADVIGLPFDVASSTSFMLQGKSDSFSRAGRTERLGIVNRLLRNDRFDVWRGQARDKQRELSESLATLEGEYNGLVPITNAGAQALQDQEALAVPLADAEHHERQASELWRLASEALRVAQEERVVVGAARTAWARANSVLGGKKQALADLQAAMESLTKRIEGAKATADRVHVLRDEHDAMKAKLGALEADGQALTAELEEIALNDSTLYQEETRIKRDLQLLLDVWKEERAGEVRGSLQREGAASVALNQARTLLDMAEKGVALLDGVPCGGAGVYWYFN
jgi:exonuclease SbcC